MVRYPIAFALLASATLAAAQQSGSPQASSLLPTETLLQVAAHGAVKAVPDVAAISTSVSSDGPNADAASGKTAETVDRMIAAVRAAGVPDSGMRTEGLQISQRFKQDKDGDDSDVVIGSRATTRLRITLRNVKLVSVVIDALASAGATSLNGPSFGFADDRLLKQRARAAAVDAAQGQASDYAQPFGLHVARVLRISERATSISGGEDIVVTASLQRLPAARNKTPPVFPGEQEVTADVWIDYALSR